MSLYELGRRSSAPAHERYRGGQNQREVVNGSDDASTVILRYIPIEVVATYVATTAAISDDSKSRTGQWALFAVFGILTAAFYLSSATIGRHTRKHWLLIAVNGGLSLVAFGLWAFALPNTPFEDFSWYKPALGGVVLLIGSLLIPLIGGSITAKSTGQNAPFR